MENLPLILVALACPVGMGLMMLFMGRGMMGMGKGDKHEPKATLVEDLPADPEKHLAVLQAQRQLLDARIAAAEGTPDKAISADEAVR